ncbi:APC family permease [Tessaracoccus caeni]|uniref:APC family permease n=1 Tax=Tessaracoccus caeni TaxID=3031239 RepID=UPI0023DB2273|nr:APC family permease [Tessaracoccus caeni]MDF1488514.1 APC family permease [Tessaracoccus caeni]
MSVLNAVKRMLVGRRMANAQVGETLLPRRLALPVYASDALSSVAYAPDEILITLSLGGVAAFLFSWPIGLAVAGLIAIVVLSYRQMVWAYPGGGGAYEVVNANLGKRASLTVASALLVDYTLTVAVSVSAGIHNAEAMLPWLQGREALAAVVLIALLALVNLRGIRASGRAFATPTYIFIGSMLLMVGIGLFRVLALGEPLRAETADYEVVAPEGATSLAGLALVAVVARAFSSGCAALTGVEALANNVPNFRPPKSHNAATVLAWLGGLAIAMMLGILALANLTHVRLIDEVTGTHFVDANGNLIESGVATVTSQLARVVFDDWFEPGFYIVVSATILVLLLAANTAFNGFPSLASMLAKDGYLPRQLHTRGDRLAYSNGIVTLALAAIAFVLVFDASVTGLIQLYIMGVFISFTASQVGLIVHWTRVLKLTTEKKTRVRYQRARVINAIGALSTAFVLVVVLVSKFTHGAWLALITMAVLYLLMLSISKHYEKVSKEVAITSESDFALPSRVRAVVLVQQVNLPEAKAIAFAKAVRPTTLTAVAVSVDDEDTERLMRAWNKQDFGIPLRVIASPYREISGPFLKYVADLRTENPRDVVSVYIPDFVVGHWWENMLHNQTSLLIRTRLHFMKGVMITSVPYQLRSSDRAKDRLRSAAQPRRR